MHVHDPERLAAILETVDQRTQPLRDDTALQEAMQHCVTQGLDDIPLPGGGFSLLVANEDVTLVRALETIGARITWTAGNNVRTSTRKLGRAPYGFSEYLNNLAAVS